MTKPMDEEINTYIDQLRQSIIDLRMAAKAEQIDPDGPLGVWVSAQERTLTHLAAFAEHQTNVLVKHVRRIEEALKLTTAFSEAEAKKAATLRGELRDQMGHMKEKNEELKQERLTAMDDVAIRMAGKIQDELKRTILVREKRWNLKQNLRYAGFGSLMLLVAFVAGTWQQSHDEARAIIDRCQKFQTIDRTTNERYCLMGLVDGTAKPIEAPSSPPTKPAK